MFSASEIFLRDAAFAHDARNGRGLGEALLLDQQLERRERRPPAGTLNMPVSLPSASRTARTLRLCKRVRRAMSSARSSTRDPRLDPPDVQIGRRQFIQRDIPRARQNDLRHFPSVRQSILCRLIAPLSGNKCVRHGGNRTDGRCPVKRKLADAEVGEMVERPMECWFIFERCEQGAENIGHQLSGENFRKSGGNPRFCGWRINRRVRR